MSNEFTENRDPCYNCEARKLQDTTANLHLSISKYLQANHDETVDARCELIESIADTELQLDILKNGLECHQEVTALSMSKVFEEQKTQCEGGKA